MDQNPTQLQKPVGEQKPTNAPVIHVMPPEFRDGKMPMTGAAPAPQVKAPVVPPPSVPKPVVKKKRRVPPVAIVGGVVLMVVGIGAVIVLTSINKPLPTTNTVKPNVVLNVTPPLNTAPAVTTPPVTTPPVTIPTTGGTDTDSDGLSDVEEVLFGSDPRIPDTDADSFLDGNEVFHLYNPRGEAPGLLIDTGFARTFNETGFSYTIIYPSRWTAQRLDDAQEEVIFHAPTGEFVQVLVQVKDPTMDIDAWYLTQAPLVEPADVGHVVTKQGYLGVTSPDQMTTYLDLGEAVYVVSYNLGDVHAINFLTTYQMMVNSLHVTR